MNIGCNELNPGSPNTFIFSFSGIGGTRITYVPSTIPLPGLGSPFCSFCSTYSLVALLYGCCYFLDEEVDVGKLLVTSFRWDCHG